MFSPVLDIFKKDAGGNPIWIDAVADLETAQHRLSQLASAFPSEYFAFDQRTQKVVPARMSEFRGTAVITVLALVGAILYIALALITYALCLAESGVGPRAQRALTDPPRSRLKDQLSPVAGIHLVQKAFSRPKPL
jgi:hypothetical protein